MVVRCVERREVVETRLDVRAVRHRETKLPEDTRAVGDDAAKRMLDTRRGPAARQRRINVLSLGAARGGSGVCPHCFMV